MNACEVSSCSRDRYCRGLCVMHYARWRKHGDASTVIRQVKTPCSVSDCGRLAHAHGLCTKHLARWKRHGDPTFETPVLGRPLSGAVISFTGIHKRLARQRGPAKKQSCVDCGGPAHEWSYDGADPSELHGLVRESMVAYSLDLDHYEPRCVSCHRRFDRAAARRRGASGTFASEVSTAADFASSLTAGSPATEGIAS